MKRIQMFVSRQVTLVKLIGRSDIAPTAPVGIILRFVLTAQLIELSDELCFVHGVSRCRKRQSPSVNQVGELGDACSQ